MSGSILRDNLFTYSLSKELLNRFRAESVMLMQNNKCPSIDSEALAGSINICLWFIRSITFMWYDQKVTCSVLSFLHPSCKSANTVWFQKKIFGSSPHCCANKPTLLFKNICGLFLFVYYLSVCTYAIFTIQFVFYDLNYFPENSLPRRVFNQILVGRIGQAILKILILQ